MCFAAASFGSPRQHCIDILSAEPMGVRPVSDRDAACVERRSNAIEVLIRHADLATCGCREARHEFFRRQPTSLSFDITESIEVFG